MNIKITDKILSLPPYISTTWSRIADLIMKGDVLVITLLSGESVHIPNLKQEEIESIFNHHIIHMDKESENAILDFSSAKDLIEKNEGSIRFAIGSSIDGIGNMMQHNPSQFNAPNLPPEILQKISTIAKIISPNDEMSFPKPEEGCNCFFCQIARTLNGKHNEHPHLVEEATISDEELQFQQWDIQQTDENLYSVINRLDPFEKYSVFLGQPIGCTCGKQGCEHILAVLKS